MKRWIKMLQGKFNKNDIRDSIAFLKKLTNISKRFNNTILVQCGR